MNKRDYLIRFLEMFTKNEYNEALSYSGKNAEIIKYVNKISVEYKSSHPKYDKIIKIDLDESYPAIIGIIVDEKNQVAYRGIHLRNGNSITREIKSFNDLVGFFSSYPLKRGIFDFFKKGNTARKRYNKILLSRHLLKDLTRCSSISYSSNGILFEWLSGNHFYSKFQIREDKNIYLSFNFQDLEIDRYDRTTPNDRELTPEEKKDVLLGTFSRGISSMYSEEYIIKDLSYVESVKKAAQQIDHFFKNAHKIQMKFRERIKSNS